MVHVVLLGDSILDNGAYTDGGPAVVDQLRERLGPGHGVTMLALDGAMIEDVVLQTRDVPSDATHLVVSMGGNNALDAVTVLAERTATVAEALLTLQPYVDGFENAYLDGLMVMLEFDVPVTVCTIYNGRFQPGPEQQAITTAGRLFNDVISRVARETGCSLIELRSVCTQPEDYANPIEPSEIGGAKIALAIAEAVEKVVPRDARTDVI